jgi:CheY-like chemotaxis protein
MEPYVCAEPAAALAWLVAQRPADVILFAPDASKAPDSRFVAALRAASGPSVPPIVLWAAVSQRASGLGEADSANTVVLPLPIRPAALHDALSLLLDGAGVPAAPQVPLFDATMGARFPLRILLAEDNATNQQVAQRLLAKLGYEAQVAATGLGVLEALRRQSFDLILMDVQMPEMSGTEATRYIRSFWPPEQQPRIAAMTAYASEENRTWLLVMGMDDYVRKPVRVEELVRVLRAAVDAAAGRTSQVDTVAGADGTLDTTLFEAFMAGVGGNDMEADAAFVNSYVADIGAQLQTLRAALDDGDTARRSRAAHTLEGLCLQIGGRDLAILVQRIKVADDAGNAALTAELLVAAEAAYASLSHAIAKRVTRRQTATD